MSWQVYVDEQLVNTGTVKQGAICGLDGATWAASPNFNVGAQEVAKIVKGFSDPSALQAEGLHAGGTRFVFLSGNEDVLRGKKGQQGVHIAKTKTAIIVAVYEEPIQPGQCAVTVEALADYLKGVNY